jgi:hypothetical protein
LAYDKARKLLRAEDQRRAAIKTAETEQLHQLQAAIKTVLDQLGQGLSLASLTAAQLDEFVALAADILGDEDLTAVLAAVNQQRTHLDEPANA